MVQQKKGSGESTTNGLNKKEYNTMSFQKKDASEARAMGNSGKGDVKQNGKLRIGEVALTWS